MKELWSTDVTRVGKEVKRYCFKHWIAWSAGGVKKKIGVGKGNVGN